MAGTLTVGLDLGGTKCLGVALDERGAVVAERRAATPRGGDAVVDTLVAVAEALQGEAGPAAAVGCGVPGLVDADGRLRFAPNLSEATGLAVRDELAARLGVPVQVDNDATCAAWGERELGSGRRAAHMVLVTLGTGIGGGLVRGGVLDRGANGFAGEVGHMVVDPNGPPCPCGKRGCWERFASGSGLGRLARDAAEAGRAPRLVALAGGDPTAVRGEHVTQAAVEGDEAALEVMRTFAWWIALGLSNLANALDPELFVVGGGLVEAGDVLLGPVRAAFTELVEAAAHRPEVPILPAALGERAGAVGAALLARELVAGG